MHPRTAELQNKILNSINERMPIVANNGCSLTLENLSFKEPDGLNDIAKQLEIKYKKNGNLNGYLRGRIVIKDKDGKVTSKGNMMNIIPVPYHTDRGTFLVNGNEKSVQSQMRLKPGSYTTKNPENNTVKTLISFQRKVGSYAPMITVTFEKTKGDFKVKINQTNFNGVDFLRALMFSDQDIARVINDSTIYDSIIKKGRGSKTPSDLYKAIIGKNPKFNDKKAIAEELYEYFRENAKFGTGEKVAQNLLGLNKGDTISLTKPVLERAFRKTFELANGKIENDDVDDIRFKDIYSGEDLIAERVEDSIDKFINKCIPMLEDTKTFNSINASTFTPVIKLHDDVNQFITKNSIVQSPEETNPLFIAAMGAKITQLGERGMSRDSTRGNNSARNLSVSGFNKIDPIETPESQSIGYDQHLALGAKIKDKTIETELIKVSNGKVSSKKENVTIEDEYNSKVAFYDTKYVSKENGKYEFTAAEVPGRYKGKMMNIPVNEIQYMDTTAHNMLGITANMIPFVSHDDGARALMGTNMQKQAINLANREVPHVTTATPDGSTYDELIGNNYGKPVKSGVDGVVEKIDNTKIIIRGNDGSKNVYQYYNYFPLNQSFINNELKVKKGDRVKKGQMIAEGWQTKDGKLALGINTRIGYMPYKGYNYEDGVVISKSYAEKMRTDEKDEIEIDIPDDYLGGKGSRVQPQLSGYTTRPDVKQKLDSDGIIKVGESVKSGSTLVAALRPIKNGGGDSLVDTIIQGKSKDLKYQFNPFKIENESYLKGEVKRITAVDNPSPGIKQKIIITLVSSNPLKEGDKVSGRHGNKGTITKILDDKLMPATEDGKPLDLLFSPLAIPSRKNLGQMLEVNAGLIAEKTGKQYVVNNFDHKEKDKVLEKLKEIGCPDGKMKVTYKEELSDGTVVDVPVENPINVGSMYIMKLKHKVDDKIQHRSNIETAPNIQDHMPTKKSGVAKGEKANPQSMGWMEMSAMQSHGAAWNILESSTIKADGGGDIKQRVAMFKAISSGKLDSRDLDVSAAPETVKVFADNLKALGMNVTPLHNGKPVSFNQVYDGLTVAPMKSSDMIKMIGKENEVTNSGLFEARGFYDPGKNRGDDENSATRKGGLLDPSIFGHMNSADSRNKWGYIKLTTPIVNPVFMNDKSHNPYALATGMKSDDLKSLSLGKKVLVIDPSAYTGFDNMSKEDKKSYIDDVKASMISAGVKPGDLVEPRALENLMEEHGQILWKAGGESIQYLLDRVDVKKELKKAEGELAKAKGKSIDACYKKCRALKNLVDNDMEASDLMMHHIPVAPTYLRPVMPDKRSGSVMYDDLNKLYENLIKANNSTKNVVENGFDLMTSLPPVEAASVSAGIFNNFSNITGVTQAKDSKKKTELNGIKQNLIEKSGLIRNKMTAKRVDFSGRAVIGVDPNLTLNEAGIPMDMAIGLYRPFLEKELVSKGYAKNAEEASRKINTADNDVKKVLQFLADDRPLILNRAPTLHKLGIQAMRPIIIDNPKGSPVRSIKLNPLIVPAYNADFDGDTMAAHVPISDKAKEEAKNLMMPSQNIINTTNGKLVYEIRHEMALGIYQLTSKWKKPVGKPIQYMEYAKLKRDYLMGQIKAAQCVVINDPIAKQQCPKGITAGSALYNMILPPKYRKYNIAWNSRLINNMFHQMYQDAEMSNWKTMSTSDIMAIMDKVKKLGFQASTRSAVSMGTTDFKKIDNVDDIYNKHVSKAMETEKDPEKAMIVGWQSAEKEIESMIENGSVMEEDNPINIIMASGSRAKKDQVRKMMTTMGVGRDVNNNLIAPIKSSLFDGLSPQEYFNLGYDSRKGMTDRAVSTSKPGELTHNVLHATQDMIIKEDDCKTSDYVDIKSSDITLKGRFAAKNIVDSKGVIICKKGQMITHEIYNKIFADNEIKTVSVRSGLRCKTPNGVCQKCYGAMPGTNKLVDIGTSIGTLASQAVGEPVTQMTMNTFHSGASNASATLGLPRLNSIFGLSEDKTNNAVLAKVSGTVSSVEETEQGTIVVINNVTHIVKKKSDGTFRKIKKTVGDTVVKGDSITFGDTQDIENGNVDDLTNIAPKDLFSQKKDLFKNQFGNNIAQTKAIDETNDYLTSTMQYAFNEAAGKNSIDRRHVETIIGKMTSKAKVIDSGNSNFMKGSVVDRATLDRYNDSLRSPMNATEVSLTSAIGRESAVNITNSSGKSIVKVGDVIDQNIAQRLSLTGKQNIKVLPKPVLYDIQMKTVKSSSDFGHDNWVSNVGSENVNKHLVRGAVLGQVDNFTDPRSRQMFGKLPNVGTGYKISTDAKTKDYSNSVSNSMLNFLSNRK